MEEESKPTRRYDSPRRREQAAATRREILETARRLFEEQGYAATTMAAIADEAGVALKTVYVVFDTKAGVLRALWNLLLRGDDDERPIAEQAWYREVLEQPDPVQQLRLNARNSRAGKVRLGSTFELIRSAAPIEPEIAELWERIQTEYHANQRAIVQSISRKGALKPGLRIDRAADLLWAINNPDVWQLLVVRRGWSPAAYERWAAEQACAQLLTVAGS
jgi:AcrR family transcriptional regulator